jgi:hypothetical protein
MERGDGTNVLEVGDGRLSRRGVSGCHKEKIIWTWAVRFSFFSDGLLPYRDTGCRFLIYN